MTANQAIGVFDSGIGGLTVANAIKKHLPKEQIIYFGDTAHLPYGDKSADAIRYYSLRISKFLIEQRCKLIVIACHSASSAAYKVLVDFYKNRTIFVNVIDPLVEEVNRQSFKKVGVIATKATTHSNIYPDRLKQANPNLSVASLAAPLLVPMIEEGFFDGNISDEVISYYLNQDPLNEIDALLLACTHYPLIREQILAYYKHKVAVLDATDIIAKAVEARLESVNLLANSQEKEDAFYVSDFTKSFENTTKVFYDKPVSLNELSIW